MVIKMFQITYMNIHELRAGYGKIHTFGYNICNPPPPQNIIGY